MTIKLIVGLQNPGASYEPTRHNAGGWFVRALADTCGAEFRAHKSFHGDVASINLDGHACHLLLPTTWMNQCGRSVRALCQFYRIAPENVLIAHDELDLSVGVVRFKTGGGHGGHNGLRDLIANLQGPGFQRLRIGIGHPGSKDLVLDYVLGKPSSSDKHAINQAILCAIDVTPKLLGGQFSSAMNILHTDKKN
jgi:PTH1 family peptidyl-tRNA hydrolase|tara:strand:- start:119379 stop:119960 length:582 start_codon:yes stop_codon:yes gene_type:complete